MTGKLAAWTGRIGVASARRGEVRAGSPRACLVSFALALVLALLSLALLPSVATSAAETLPSGFREETVLSGLTNPTSVQFSKDGRVFVAEKSGLIKVFDSFSDPTPKTFADLRTNVHNFWDRGLLGMALDPDFPDKPYVYVLYTYDHELGSSSSAPKWGQPGVDSDPCPSLKSGGPGATDDGCVVSGRLSRLQANGDTMSGSEQVMIEDWCQQYPSHSVGNLAFGQDGALYVSGGDGANFNLVDYGQGGGSSGSPTPKNPCGDPPVGVGGTQMPPTAEGGALRSQDLRTTGDPVGLNGTILRVDPTTGDALPDNPLYGNADPNARRIVAYGLRSPFRFAVRPGTNEVWLGDVGWGDWEEINRISNPTDPAVNNFGWPCYEGAGRQGGYDGAGLNICKDLSTNAVTAPYYAYNHSANVVPGETCGTGSSSIAGLAFYNGGSYPASYNGSLFFADYSRNCIWAMTKDANGLPDPASLSTFVAGAAAPVDLKIGPGGDLFYVDFTGGRIRRIRYDALGGGTTCATGEYLAEYYNNQTLSGPPTFEHCETNINNDWKSDGPGNGLGTDNFSARWTGKHNFEAGNYAFTATADDGIRVLVDGEPIIDAWQDQPATTYQASRYLTAGEHEVKVEYYENGGDAVAQVSWQKDDSGPTATIGSPSSSLKWKVNDVIDFSGAATDPKDGTLHDSALSWALILHHCSPVDSSSCHEHPLQSFDGVASGSFPTPDHEYPSYLELRLTATDSSGLKDVKSVRLDPQTVDLTFQSNPSGLQLVGGGGSSATTPFSRTVIVGSKNSISAPSTQTLGVPPTIFPPGQTVGRRATISSPAPERAHTPPLTSRLGSSPRPPGLQPPDLQPPGLQPPGPASTRSTGSTRSTRSTRSTSPGSSL